MIRVEPFRMADLDLLPVQERHNGTLATVLALPRDVTISLLETRWSWTAWSPSGIALACCGVLPNGEAWAFLACDLRRYMVPVSRAVRKVMQDHARAVGPVTATTLPDFPQAERWVRLLGFRQEGPRWVFW